MRSDGWAGRFCGSSGPRVSAEKRSADTSRRPGSRCAAGADRANAKQNRQLRRGCPPTLDQNRQFPRPEVSTDSPPTRAPSASACAPYRELIEEAVGRGRNAVAIYQDLVDDHGFTAKYASVKRFVAKLRGTTPAGGAGRDHHGAR